MVEQEGGGGLLLKNSTTTMHKGRCRSVMGNLDDAFARALKSAGAQNFR